VVSAKYVLAHYQCDSRIMVWSVEELLKPESTHTSAFLCDLNIEKPFKCEELIADEYQVFIFGVGFEVSKALNCEFISI